MKWNDNGWTCIQEANKEKHILEINCRAEDGKVVEVITRHNDGEEHHATVLENGVNALPMDIAEFQKKFTKKLIELK